jgi:Pyridoxamine 5'-phosphate oxidase
MTAVLVAYASRMGAAPRIIPVNYAVRLDSVAFRSGQQTEVAGLALGRVVAFEVDQVDDFLRSGWSVLVLGKLAEMSPSRSGCSLSARPRCPGPAATGPCSARSRSPRSAGAGSIRARACLLNPGR